MTRAQMIENFSLERVNPAPASFDPTKLVAFQAHYMQRPAPGREGRGRAAVTSSAPAG